MATEENKLKLKDLLPVMGGLVVAGVSQASRLKPVRMGGLIAGGTLAAWGLYSWYEKSQREKEAAKKFGTDPAVGQALRLYEALGGWWTSASEAIGVATQITCWDAVVRHYGNVSDGRAIVSDIGRLSSADQERFMQALKRGNKHLQCDKKGNSQPNPKRPDILFPKGTVVSTRGEVNNIRDDGNISIWNIIARVGPNVVIGISTGEQFFDKETKTYFTKLRHFDGPTYFIANSQLREKKKGDKQMSVALLDDIKDGRDAVNFTIHQGVNL
ncbi:MAG: hypothetical protein ACK5X3_09990 [Pseudomonadota bacterium]|jgi:hypothetical protein